MIYAALPTAGSEPQPQIANVIAIGSGKGGVGKTWLAVTLAHVMAKDGRRTLLFDGDLGLANVDIQLGLMPDQDLGDVFAGRFTLRQIISRYPAGGFDVIAGRSGSGRLANIPPTRQHALSGELTMIAGGYDHVIVDLGAGVERSVRQFVRSAASLVVLTTDEPTALTDAYAFIKLSCQDRPLGEIGVVVNMAASKRDGERTYQTLLRACQGFLKISPPLLGVVRRDTKVKESIRNQASILTRHPNAEATLDVEGVAAKLLSSGAGA